MKLNSLLSVEKQEIIAFYNKFKLINSSLMI